MSAVWHNQRWKYSPDRRLCRKSYPVRRYAFLWQHLSDWHCGRKLCTEIIILIQYHTRYLYRKTFYPSAWQKAKTSLTGKQSLPLQGLFLLTFLYNVFSSSATWCRFSRIEIFCGQTFSHFPHRIQWSAFAFSSIPDHFFFVCSVFWYTAWSFQILKFPGISTPAGHGIQ